MRLCFFGASKFGFRCLETAMHIPEVEVVGIVTAAKTFSISYSPDKPVTNVLYADFEKLADKSHSPPIFKMNSAMKDPAVIEFIKGGDPEFILAVGWYHMIPASIRNIPHKGVAGIHASLLPKYRGGAPLVWALINGEEEAGLTLFYFDEGVDSGDIIGQCRTKIRLCDTISTLYTRVEEDGISLLKGMLPRIAAGTAPRTPQKAAEETVWPQRKPEDGMINWSSPSLSLYNFIRAQTWPYPGAFTFWKGKKLTIWEAKFWGFAEFDGEVGQVVDIIDSEYAKGILIATKDNDVPLLISKVGTERTSMMNACDFAKKENLVKGDVLGKI